MAPRLIVAAVILSVTFIVAAVVGGGHRDIPTSAPAPLSPGPLRPPPAFEAATDLGYPAFATSNTTRVGSADPTSNAAGIALATYPSVTPAQRPAAVAIASSGDWQGAIAASVLMAAPLGPPAGVHRGLAPGTPTGAPLLFSESDGLPEPTTRALYALNPRGNRRTRGVQAFVIGDAASPRGLEAREVPGADPAALAASVAALRDELFKRPPAHIVIASTNEPAFAMPAAAWAARSGDPVLFSGPDKLPASTAAVLRTHPKTPVFVLGPKRVISTKVMSRIARIDPRVRRVSGDDPVTNAIALARYAQGGFGWNVNDPGHGFVVVRSDSPLDAAAASPLSASGAWGPLLLTDSAAVLPPALRGYLLSVKPGYTTDPTRAFYNHVWVVGDQVAIDMGEQAEIDQLAELAKIGGGP